MPVAKPHAYLSARSALKRLMATVRFLGISRLTREAIEAPIAMAEIVPAVLCGIILAFFM